MNEYLAKDGTPITDDMVDAWARQAEEGFADAELSREPDPFVVRRGDMRAHTVRVPEALWALVEQAASARHITVSEFTRQALSRSLSAMAMTREQKIDLYATTHGLTREAAIERLIDKALQ